MEKKLEVEIWPNGSGFFQQTNVEAMVRGIPKGNEILGLPQEEKGISDIINNPSKTMVNTEK